MLQRIWTGIVGAVAGAAVGLVTTIVLVQSGVELETALCCVWVAGALGAVLGLACGGRRSITER